MAVHQPEFHNAWNDQVLVYGKMTKAQDNVVLVAVNLDPHHAQGCNFEVPLWRVRACRLGEHRRSRTC